MHLNDQQLIELDEKCLNHLASCSQCKQRMEVLTQLRVGLQAEDIPKPSVSLDEGWQALKIAQQAHQKNLKFESKKRSQRWSLSHLPLAASILLVVLFIGDKYISKANIDHSMLITALIEQNNLLQKQLTTIQKNQHNNIESDGQLRYSLTVQDRKIQQAYIDSASEEQKLLLWLERQKIIERWFEKQNTPQLLEI